MKRWLFNDAAVIFLTMCIAATMVIGGEEQNSEAAPAVSIPTSIANERPDNSLRIEVDRLQQVRAPRPVKDVFDTVAPQMRTEKREELQAALAVTAVPPPPPTAPPLPFAYTGKMIEKGRLKIFLSANGMDHTIMGGETIDGIYRIEEINEETVQIRYLPLDVLQTLDIPAHYE